MNQKIKVVIAEDNTAAQEILMSFIEPLDRFELVGVVNHAEKLLELTANIKPDLIIADINMSQQNGIDVIRSCLEINPTLKFIFTSASKEHAVKAFDLNAVDYMLKPLKKERLYVALERAKNLLVNTNQLVNNPILTIKMDRTSYFIHFFNIIFIEKADRKTIIHTFDQQYETNDSLDYIFQKLDSRFYRTHRSFIANTTLISHITLEGETYFVHFRNYPNHAHLSKLQKNQLIKAISEN
ncbi:two-component system LytT family response regulator [Salirhabdus euzebyi]|uniref:Two-component system LytT family response regulator n=1 Tax=Salirhabdus euzebyi TaxID=394506 RepID=A0A841PS74_9BACI|nr:LytTR family DNA-binding domain-containing protein [Salirhabdus euzebyi]MBB6451787.1 two-component system LytT family response regulator [Salirhabdus euzebyi]